MTSFKLTVNISDNDLAIIQRADQKIVLVRSLRTQDPANVAWVVQDPLPRTVVEWNEEYGLFASLTSVLEGRVIVAQSQTDAQMSQLMYAFSGNVFSPPRPDSSLEPGQYRVVNQESDVEGLTFGMLQSLSIAGNPQGSGIPTNASFVPRNNAATFTPLDTVTIFLSSAVQSGQVVSVPSFASDAVVTSRPTTLPFSSDLTEIEVEYSSTLGQFFRS